MKKLFFLLLALIPMMLIAQQDSTGFPPQDIPVPVSIFDIFSDLQGWFASTFAVAGLTIFLTLIVVKIKPEMKQILKQVIALAIAVLLIVAGNIANIGFMAEFNVQSTIVYGLVTGFIANGWYDLKNVTK